MKRYALVVMIPAVLLLINPKLYPRQQSGQQKKINALLEDLIDRTNRRWTQTIQELLAIGEPAVDPLIKMLEGENELRWRAADTLGAIHTEKAVEALIRALDNLGNDNVTRGKAAAALGRTKSPKSIDSLLKAMRDPDSYIQQNVFESLQGMNSAKVIEAYIEALKDESWSVREGSVSALTDIGEPAIEFLHKALKNQEIHTRWEATRILGRIQAQASIRPLIEMLQDPDWMVRNEAAVALSRTGKEEIEELLIESLDIHSGSISVEAVWILGEMKAEKAVNRLIQLLNDGNIGWMAATALGKIGSFSAVEPLSQALSSKDVKLRQSAAWALEKMGAIK